METIQYLLLHILLHLFFDCPIHEILKSLGHLRKLLFHVLFTNNQKNGFHHEAVGLEEGLLGLRRKTLVFEANSVEDV